MTEVGHFCDLDHSDVTVLLHVLVGEEKDWKYHTAKLVSMCIHVSFLRF